MDIPHFVYSLYNSSDDVIYIGVTGSVAHRMNNHAAAKPWWPEVSRMGVEQFPSREAAESAEKCGIVSAQPRYNITFVPGNYPLKRNTSSRIGRPPKEDPRTTTKQIRFSDAELQVIAKAMEVANVKAFSEWARPILLRAAKRH